MRCALLAVLLGLSSSTTALAAPAPKDGTPTVFLVRHAEKVDESRDPDLSEAGRRRAQQLKRFFSDAGVTRLFCTQYKRTQQTLQPLSDAVGKPCQMVRAQEPDALVAQIRRLNTSEVVVVAGHSNTLATIAEKLGAPKGQLKVAHHHYDDVVLLKLTKHGTYLLRLHTGPANPAAKPAKAK